MTHFACCGIMCLSLLGALGAQDKPLSAKLVRIEVPRWQFGGHPVPKVTNGVLLWRNADRVSFRALDLSGKGALDLDSRLSLPEAAVTNIKDLAAGRDGTIVITASGQARDGALASFLVWLTAKGEAIRVVRTSPYAASSVAMLPDGSVWTVGRVYDGVFNDAPAYEFVRSYGPDGRLKAKGIMKSELLPRTLTHRDLRLLTNGDRVGVYVVPTGEYLALDSLAQIDYRIQLRSPGIVPGVAAIGAALLADGSICVSTAVEDLARNRVDVAVFRQTAQRGDPQRIALEGITGLEPGYLIGSDGPHLVYYSKGAQAKILWLRPE